MVVKLSYTVYYSTYRSALQISMAENNQLKAGQLIPNSSVGSSSQKAESTSQLDQMFNGLGLDSYIGKKDTGSQVFLGIRVLPENSGFFKRQFLY